MRFICSFSSYLEISFLLSQMSKLCHRTSCFKHNRNLKFLWRNSLSTTRAHLFYVMVSRSDKALLQDLTLDFVRRILNGCDFHASLLLKFSSIEGYPCLSSHSFRLEQNRYVMETRQNKHMSNTTIFSNEFYSSEVI